jgi:antitoxin ParD1/3/4
LAKFAKTDILSLNVRSRSNMPTRNISLTEEQDAFVEKLVKAGEYQNASEALRDALRALEQRRREDELKLKALRMQIKAGTDAIKQGDFAEIDESDLDDYLEGLKVVPRKRSR